MIDEAYGIRSKLSHFTRNSRNDKPRAIEENRVMYRKCHLELIEFEVSHNTFAKIECLQVYVHQKLLFGKYIL